MNSHRTILNGAEREAFLSALADGQTPPEIAPLIQVGRKAELLTIKSGFDLLHSNGSWSRAVVGPPGSGKTQLANTAAAMAHSNGIAVARAVVTRNRRLAGTNGEPRNLLRELVLNLSVNGSEAGGGLRLVLESLCQKVLGGNDVKNREIPNLVRKHCRPLLGLNKGDALVNVITAYLRAAYQGDEETKDNALRWMRGQFDSSTEAKRLLGVTTIIDGSDILHYPKLLAQLTRLADFGGLVLILDELGVLCNLPKPDLRRANFEVIHTMLDDRHQGRSPGLGILMAATPDFLEHKERGLYSQDALRTRLAPVGQPVPGLNYTGGWVMKLQRLSNEEFFHMLRRVRDLLLPSDTSADRLSEEGLLTLLKLSMKKLGSDEFLDPRDLLRQLARLVILLDQNPEKSWRDLLSLAAEVAEQPPAQKRNPTTDDPSGAAKQLSKLKI